MQAKGFCRRLDLLEPNFLVGVLRLPPLLTSNEASAPRSSLPMISTHLHSLKLKGLVALAVTFACGFGGLLAASPIWLAAGILLACDAWPRFARRDCWG